MKGRGFSESKNTKMKQNETNVTPEKDKLKAAKDRGPKLYNPLFLWPITAVRKCEHIFFLVFSQGTEMNTFLCCNFLCAVSP